MQYIIVLLLSGILGLSFSIYRHPIAINQPKTIQTFHYPALWTKQLRGDPKAGKKIFYEFCASCHDRQPAIEVNAPPIRDKKAWELRRRKGINSLLKTTINGVGAMPARGGCFECSDTQLREAIKYMIS